MTEQTITTELLKNMLHGEETLQQTIPAASTSHGRSVQVSTILRELIERRERDELNATAHGMAYQVCVSVIDGGTLDVSEEAGAAGWHDLEILGDHFDPKEEVAYLDARGLIERDPAHPTWIAIREESEATR